MRPSSCWCAAEGWGGRVTVATSRSGAVAPTRAFIDSWEQAALLAQQATGGVIVEVDAEDTANTFEVDVVRKGVEIDLDVNVVTGRMNGQIGRWPPASSTR